METADSSARAGLWIRKTSARVKWLRQQTWAYANRSQAFLAPTAPSCSLAKKMNWNVQVQYALHQVYIACFLQVVTLKSSQDFVTPQPMKLSGLELRNLKNPTFHIAWQISKKPELDISHHLSVTLMRHALTYIIMRPYEVWFACCHRKLCLRRLSVCPTCELWVNGDI